MRQRHRVLLADDHAMVAEALAEYLGERFDLVGVVGDGRRMLEAARQLHPDVIVADLSMPVLSGMEALRALQAEGSKSRVIFLTMHDDPHMASEALRAGAAGYLLKHAAGEELIKAITEVLEGRVYLSPLIASETLAALARPAAQSLSRLTPRQQDVLRLVAQGLTLKEIAAALHISPRTAETHKYDMMRALELQTTAELIQFAIRNGVIAV